MKLNSFHGGVHPAAEKSLTAEKPFEQMPPPAKALLPLSQHLGKPARLLLSKGDYVCQGALAGESDGFISANVHVPINGTVQKPHQGGTVSGFPGEMIAITAGEPPEPAEGAEAVSTEPVRLQILDLETATPQEIISQVKEAGIVGQGGAAFPANVKLVPPPEKQVNELIINGCECEPYLTRDYRLMLERTHDLLEGIRLICRALKISKATIGIENNKPAAIRALQEAVTRLAPARSQGADWPQIEIMALQIKYPQGAEKMLIKAITGREIPPGGLPMDAQVAIQNIGTVLAMRDAVLSGLPQTTAALTVTGRGIREPKNLLVHVGTPVSEVLEFCGGMTEDAARVIIGGPMMGIAQHNLEAPVVKATSGILVLTQTDVAEPVTTACLSCGKCVTVCPLNLLPSRLARLSELDRFEDAQQLGLETCMECGSCAYTCPAHIPLVQWFRMGKQGVRQLNRSQ